METQTKKRPAEKYSVSELLFYRQRAVKAIASANAKINMQGGWIAREANWKVIKSAQNDINVIDEELKLR
jgi:hypothetical protein